MTDFPARLRVLAVGLRHLRDPGRAHASRVSRAARRLAPSAPVSAAALDLAATATTTLRGVISDAVHVMDCGGLTPPPLPRDCTPPALATWLADHWSVIGPHVCESGRRDLAALAAQVARHHGEADTETAAAQRLATLARTAGVRADYRGGTADVSRLMSARGTPASVSTLRRWVREGRLPATTDARDGAGGERLVIRLTDAVACWEQLRAEAAAA